MQTSMLPPLISFDTIDRAELNNCLRTWGHKMGPWERPDFGDDCLHGLRHHGELVGVTAAAGMISPATCGLSRAHAFELGRVCAARRDICRVVIRIWREFVFPAICKANGWQWVISYQDAVLHSGDLYRFDGWVRLGRSNSGTDQRSGKRGRRKVIWGWHADAAQRAIRALPVE